MACVCDMKEVLCMTDPLRHESYLAFESAIQDAGHKSLASCEALAKQLQKVHDAIRDLSMLVDTEQANREEQWRSSGERLEQFRKALADGLGIAEGEKARIAELEAVLSEREQSLGHAEDRLRTLEQDHGELVASSGAARERVASLEKREQQAQERITALEGQVSRLEQEAQAHQAENEAARALASKNQETAQRLAAAEQEAATLREQVAATRATVEKQDRAIQTLTKDLAQARAADEEQNGTIQGLTRDLAQANAEAAQWREKAQTLADSVAPVPEETILDMVLAPEDGSALEIEKERDTESKKPLAPEAAPKREAVPAAGGVPGQTDGGGERTRFGRRPLIGQLLLDARVISKQQLDDAVAVQTENTNRHIGEILIEKGYTDEEAIAQVLATQCQTKFFRLAEQPVDSSAVALVNERLAQQHTCIAIRANGGALVLAMANPMNLLAIEDVERATNRKVEVVVATPSDIKDAIAKFYWEPE